MFQNYQTGNKKQKTNFHENEENIDKIKQYESDQTDYSTDEPDPNFQNQLTPYDFESTSDESEEIEPYVDYRHDIKFYLILGPPGSGKSHLGRNLIVEGFKRNLWDYILVLAVSAGSGDYDYIDSRLKCADPQRFKEKIEKLTNIQIRETENAKRNNTRVPRALLVVDDPLGSVNWHDPIWKKIVSTYRQWYMDLMIMAQYIAALDLCFYTYYKKAYIFKQVNPDSYKRVFERFVSRHQGKTDMNSWQDVQKKFSTLEKYQFLVIETAEDIENPIYIGQAKPLSEIQHIKIKL